MVENKLGKLFESERRRRGLTLRDMAEKLNCSAMAISLIEQGKTKSGALIDQIVAFFGILPEYMVKVRK